MTTATSPRRREHARTPGPRRRQGVLGLEGRFLGDMAIRIAEQTSCAIIWISRHGRV